MDLENTALTNASVAHLGHLKNLNNLSLKGTKVTGGGRLRLKRSLPRCNIQPEPPADPSPVVAEQVLKLGGRLVFQVADNPNVVVKPGDTLPASASHSRDRPIDLQGRD